ncbi:MAG: AAA family ATPase, partial [Coleofasciculaceae cyanobacterium]
LKTIIPSVYQPLPDLAEVTELLKKILPEAGLLQPGEEIKQELDQAVSGLSVEEIKMGVRLVACRRRQMGGWGDRGMGRGGDTLDNVGTRRNGDTFDDAGTRRRGDNFDDTGTRRRGDAERNLENIFTSTETISPHPPITQSPSLPVHHQKHSNSSHLPIPPSPHPTPYSLLPTPSQNLTPQLLDYKIERLQGLGLDFIPKPNVSNFGGLDRLKQGIEEVRADFSAEARTYNIPLPKGWLLVGPPGTGKTFAAKVCAYNLGFPLISVGVDAVMSGGAAYLKRLLRRIEACSPAVCYFDEFDKFFTANRATGEDSQSKQVLGVLLTWLQEKRSPVFVIATLNRLDALPPELTRAGRFDKIYYVGFPQANERQEIFQLHASRFDKRYLSGDSPLTEREWKILLGKTVNCTGAEIRSIIESAARKLFHQGLPLVIGLSELLEQREGMIPLYARDTERVLAMENRAKYVAEPASSLDQSVFAPPVTSYWGD